MSEPRPSFGAWLRAKQAEPKVITVKRYVCQFCNRGHSTRKAATEHIARCWKNPAARGCKTCVHFTVARDEDGVGYRDTERCTTLGIDLSEGLRTGCPGWEAQR